MLASQAVAAAALVLTALLAGCAEPEPAETSPCDITPYTTVTAVHSDRSIAVENGSLILRARDGVWLADRNGCHGIAVQDVLVGDRVGHDAEEIATSYPAQAWPDNIVIHR